MARRGPLPPSSSSSTSPDSSKAPSKGEGLGNKFLSHIRECDAIIHVVRCFEDPNIIHVDGSIDPMRDLETINMELIFSDMEMLERRIDRVKKSMKGDKTLGGELELLERVYAALSDGKNARSLDYTEDELAIMQDCQAPFSMKPVIYAANISEDEIGSDMSDDAGYRSSRLTRLRKSPR